MTIKEFFVGSAGIVIFYGLALIIADIAAVLTILALTYVGILTESTPQWVTWVTGLAGGLLGIIVSAILLKKSRKRMIK